MSRQVVVLGGGVGGLAVADALRGVLPDGDRIFVVDRATEGILGLSLLWVMRGWREPDDVRFTRSVLAGRGIEFVAAQVTEIRADERRVKTDAGELEYDALVIALGAQLDLDLLPGLREALASGVAGEYYTLDGATSLRGQLPELEGGRVCFVVSGVPFKCPAAPYEGALLLDDLCRERGVREAVDIDILTPEPHPMPVAGPAVGEALVSMLHQQGIGFRPQVAVERIETESRQLVLETGERQAFDLLIAVPPHVPPPPVARVGLSEQGWIPVRPRTLTTALDRVWALGDVTSLPLANGRPLPKAAVFALAQADAVAAGVARALGCDAPEPWFTGEGHCWIEVGDGKAAKGAGSFLAPSGPVVELHEPSAEQHAEKENEERAWIERWTGAANGADAAH
jgi:sulfide:quinone oxidoreductase